jgi:ABC-type spermidine/putrescine transport system permease subunit II
MTVVGRGTRRYLPKPMNNVLKINYGKVGLAVFASVTFIFLMIPSLMAIPMSFTNTLFLVFPPEGFTVKWYHNFLTEERWVEPTLLSLRLAGVTTLVSLILGTLASLALVRGVLPFKRTINLFVISPMMIPVIIIAFAAYGLYAKLHLIGSFWGIVTAHTILCCPFVILIINANLYRFDINLEKAARNLGASAMKTFLLITLPLIKPGMISAGVFCFITSMDELVLTMFLIGTRKTTLPLRIFSQIQFRIDPVVATASTFFVVASIAIFIVLAFIRRDSKKRPFDEEQEDEFDRK